MSTAIQSEDLEREICGAVDIPLHHVPDEEEKAYDAVLEGAVVTSPSIRLVGLISADEGTEVEIKTCERWIEDRHSYGNRRRGRWKIDRDAHRQLAVLGGIYLLVVRDAGEIVAWAMVPAADFANALGWTRNGNGERRESSAQVPWTRVFDPTDLRGGGDVSR